MLKQDRIIRKKRVRAKLEGTAMRPRISVFRSNKFTYAQAIDDVKAVTLASAKNQDAAKTGQDLAEKLLKLKIKQAVFDRSGYKYHGRVKEIADGVREKGVNI